MLGHPIPIAKHTHCRCLSKQEIGILCQARGGLIKFTSIHKLSKAFLNLQGSGQDRNWDTLIGQGGGGLIKFTSIYKFSKAFFESPRIQDQIFKQKGRNYSDYRGGPCSEKTFRQYEIFRNQELIPANQSHLSIGYNYVVSILPQ